MATKTVKTTTKKVVATKKVAAVKKVAAPKEPKAASALDPRVFNYTASESLLAQVIHVYRDNSHQNTSKTKTRGELNRTTKKMYKQKGTGNARHGSKMSPTFVGGGIAFGPTGIKPNNLKINRKMKAAALAGMLSIYAKNNNIEMFAAPELSTPNAKSVKSVLVKDNTVLVVAKETPAFISSVRNFENVTLVEAAKLNAYDIASGKHVALTQSAHDQLVARLTPLLKTKTAK